MTTYVMFYNSESECTWEGFFFFFAYLFVFVCLLLLLLSLKGVNPFLVWTHTFDPDLKA